MTVIALSAADEAALGVLVAADKAGVALGRDFALSTAIRLEQAGFARVQPGVPYRAHATGAGKAHHRRSSL